MERYDHSNWHGTTDGTPWMQRSLVKLLRFIPVWFACGVMSLAIPFYMFFDRRGYRASYSFFRRRMGRPALHSFFSVYANEFRMGQVVIDRFAIYAGRKYRLEADRMEIFSELEAGENGFVQLSSHAGNTELAGYSLNSVRKKIYALVYPGETKTVMKQRAAMFSRNNIVMVPVSDDMSHLFTINSAVLAGDVVTMPGDRLYGSAKSISCRFFGENASFPAGPFRFAAERAVPMVATFVMKEGMRRYRILLYRIGETLSANENPHKQAEAMAAEYASLLESVVRRYPTQWFNFYDFWK